MEANMSDLQVLAIGLAALLLLSVAGGVIKSGRKP
jgi:hypothetical protein